MKKYFFYLIALTFLLAACQEDEPIVTEFDTIVEAINAYRIEKGLAEIPYSSSLTTVAEIHANDLYLYHDIDTATNKTCNMHSWSDNGEWTSCCYTADHAQASCMWDKPRELTNYTGSGFENAVYVSSGITPKIALDMWIESEGHHNLIINKDIWANIEWKAIGGAMQGGYAVVWFGRVEDTQE